MLPGNRGAIERILRYAKKHGAVVSTATNAVMLPKMLDLIGPEEGKIQNVQVTLDGEQAFHDGMRIPQSGAPTFEEIIRSLHELIKVKAHTSIRIHLHPNRLESTQALAEYLDREGILGHDHVNVYFAPINSFDGRDAPLSNTLSSFPNSFNTWRPCRTVLLPRSPRFRSNNGRNCHDKPA